MSDAVVYAGAAMAVMAVWILGLIRLDVFTPDDVRALRRLADLRGYARPRSHLERTVARMPVMRRLQAELDLERLLAVSGRGDTPLGFFGRSVSISLGIFAAVFALDALGRASLHDWPVTPWIAPLSAVLILLWRMARLRAQARESREAASRTLEDMTMTLAILTDTRGLQLHDAVRLMSRCAVDDSLERLLDKEGWRRLVSQTHTSTVELYRLVGSAYELPLLVQMADAQSRAHVGVPEREIYTRLALSVYQERLADARARGARAKVLVTLPVAAMLIPLLLLLGRRRFKRSRRDSKVGEAEAGAWRVVPSLLSLGLIAAAVVTIGVPDPSAASRFFNSPFADVYDGASVAALLCWAVIVAATTVTLPLIARPRQRSSRRGACIALLVAASGAVILAAGVIHHTARTYSMCCGSTNASVEEALHLVH